MNRTIGYTPINTNVEIPDQNETLISSEDFLGGLITDIDPVKIPPNALQNCNNILYDRGLLLRRNGLINYSLGNADGNKVLAIFIFFQTLQGISLLRFSKNSIYKSTPSGWSAFAGPALTGNNDDYFSFAVADNRAFFSNNGINQIQELLPNTNTWANLGNAPQYRYITSAFNRIIGANLAGATPVPYEIGWSGDINYGEWNPSVDISAGSTPLVDSPSDLSDDITGIYNLASVLCITRQRSIWLATNQPSATNPFFFYVAVPRIGCDVPRSIQLFADGLIFYNFLTSSVYYYAPGPNRQDQPEDISGPIKRYLKASIDNPANVFASFSYDRNTYTLYVNSSSAQVTKAFSFNLNTKTWSYEEFQNVTCVADLDYNTSTLSINDLLGNINSLLGSIESLGGVVANANRLYGFLDGSIASQAHYSGLPSELANITLTDKGSSFESSIVSKTIKVPLLNAYITKCRVIYTPFTSGNVSLYYSKNDGLTWNLYKTVAVDSTKLAESQIITGNKFINCRHFIWKFVTTDCMLAVNGFETELAEPEINRGPISRR